MPLVQTTHFLVDLLFIYGGDHRLGRVITPSSLIHYYGVPIRLLFLKLLLKDIWN